MNIADIIFERIKHGDETHQQWLREKSYEVAALVERLIRDDECAQIAAGFRNTRQQNLHDYLDKRVAKRNK